MRNIWQFFLFQLLSVFFVINGYRKMIRPRGFGNIPMRELDTRSRVDPPASNMLEMKWHNGAQTAAQNWAEACKKLSHDNPLSRWVEDFGSCGQNIYVSSVKVPWKIVMKSWFLEHVNFTYGRNNSIKDTGHYTQMVWYRSHRVGCGFHFCGKHVAGKPFYNYVCNYCPIGNHPRKLTPYAQGEPCSSCRNHCKYKKLCTNSCPFADFWSNCPELNATWNRWLCEEDQYHGCRATCFCKDAIR